MLKHQIQKHIQKKYPDGELGPKSCEMIARDLIETFSLSRCSVSEDGENGAILTVI